MLFTPTQLRDYSLQALILSRMPGAAEPQQGEFERSCDRLLRNQFDTNSRGAAAQLITAQTLIPAQLLTRHTRDLTAVTGSSLTGSTMRADLMTNPLQPTSVCLAGGATVLDGLFGPGFDLPFGIAPAAVEWLAEGVGPTEASPTFGKSNIVPHRIAAWTEVSRKLMLTSNVEEYLRSGLSAGLWAAIDHAVIHGGGTDEPTGIVGMSGVGSVAGAGMSWDGMMEFIRDTGESNADTAQSIYAAHPTTANILRTRPRVIGNDRMLLEDNSVAGRAFVESASMDPGYIMFGDFHQVILFFWGAIEMIVNPFSLDIEGLVRITVNAYCDIGVLQPASFSVSSSVS